MCIRCRLRTWHSAAYIYICIYTYTNTIMALFPALPRVQRAPTDRDPYQARSLLPDKDALYQASKEHYTIAATLPRDPHWAYLYGDDPADCAQRAELKLSTDSFVRYDAGEIGYAVTHWRSLIGAAYPTLAAKPLSDQLLSIALLSMSERALPRSIFQCVEYFSGCGQITYFTLLQGLRVCLFVSSTKISPLRTIARFLVAFVIGLTLS